MTSWQPLDSLIEDDACTHRVAVDGGDDPDDDRRTARHLEIVWARRPEVTFAYLAGPHLAGHEHGWGHDGYLEALADADTLLGQVLDTVGPTCDVLVTTGHSGIGHDHGQLVPDSVDTFIALRADGIPPGSTWERSSILDIAPTVAHLAGVDPHRSWTGSGLLHGHRPVVDWLLDLVRTGAGHAYGERVSMLDHALQTAAAAESAGADDELAVAALLHDVGHVLGRPGAHGDPDHATVAAERLGPWLPAPVVEPIRLHVAAKRRLVATDPGYSASLSDASMITLAQQGGPMDDGEAEAFDAEPHADRAIALRRFDDGGKQAGREVPPLEHWRTRLAALLAEAPIDAAWARHACGCEACRDPGSGQRLTDAAALVGWTVLGSRRHDDHLEVSLARGTERHEARVPTRPEPTRVPVTRWDHDLDLRSRARLGDEIAAIAADVATSGVALVVGLGAEPGTVLELAERLGHVRETDYGRLFDVRTEPEPANLASAAVALPLHTDNPYRDPVPTVQALHCLTPAPGGATRLADGRRAAEKLRLEDERAFTLLATTMIRFRYTGGGRVDHVAEVPTIDVAPDGTIRRVAVNNRSIDTALATPVAEALARFVDILDTGAIEVELDTGDAVIFDNRRVLHARTGFDPSSCRHLQGCYLDMDALTATWRRSR